jgi:[protein-PII] uridylyltransferase
MATVQTETQFTHLKRTYRDKVLAHAATRLLRNKPPSEPFDISGLLRTFLKIEDQRLKTALRFGASGCQTAAARSFVLDLAVESAYCEATRLCEVGGYIAGAENDCALVALGGYGRGELAPYSDLDILFLHSGHRATQVRQIIEQVLRLLWDAKLTVGHSFHTISECVATARRDPHLQTALISMRLLAGNGALYNSLLTALEKERRKRGDSFIAAIRNEHDVRQVKFSSNVCLQEPNVKDGAGGLRDLHTALWTAYARYGCRTLEELRARDIISESEQQEAASAYDFLWRVRHALHLLTRRKTERLALDLQPTLAQEFGYKPSSYLLASEKFMRDYYHHARTLHHFSENLYMRASESEPTILRRFRRQSTSDLIEPLSIRDSRLQLDSDAKLFIKDPLRLFDAFSLAQATGLPFGHGLREAIRQSLKAVDHKFRASVEASDAFLKLLRRRGRVGYVLRLMHEVGFLPRFLPEFGRINLLIQHDLYHHYTVDEHTLKAVEALDDLYNNQEKQHAHLRLIFDEVEDAALLHLSLLLHDIGKGRGRGHIPRGAKIAERICRRLHLSAQDEAKVVLLVRLHVMMAQLAQRRDINETQVVADFAAQLGTLDALNMLLLLTYADLNAVAPGVWSEWKGTLLWELYRRTRTALTGSHGPLSEAEATAHFKEQIVNWLGGQLPYSDVERHVALMPDRYVRVTRPDAAATHLHLIEELKSDLFIYRWVRHGDASTELTICTQNRHALFADIAGTLAAHGIEILNAELNTREDGIALDVFVLRESSTHHAIDMRRYATIEASLRKAVAGESDVAALVERWRTNNAPRKRVVPAHMRKRNLRHVVCDNESARTSTLIEVQAADEPGLAYKVASVLAALGLDIVCAKIATEKSDALDVFYVTDADGRKLAEATMQAVEVELIRKLSQVGASSNDAVTTKSHQEKSR